MMEMKVGDCGTIRAKSISIGDNVTFNGKIDINITGNLTIGSHSTFLNGCVIRGNNISIGEHFFTMAHRGQSIDIGGGGIRYNEKSNLKIGDRCVIHNSHINLANSVTIGNDVGFSPNVDLITHGFWASVLEGYPRSVEPITIGNNVIVGWGSTLLMGIHITNDIVIAAKSTVTKSLWESGIYGGTPAKIIKKINKLSKDQQDVLLVEICQSFKKILQSNNVPFKMIDYDVSSGLLTVDDFIINPRTLEYNGIENNLTDAFRDFLRKYGIKIYTGRGFNFNLEGN